MTGGRYRTVAGRGRTRFELRGSEFVGRVARAESVAAAESFVESVESEREDATHTVPAYRVPADGASTARTAGAEGGAAGAGNAGPMLREWSSDDGEPTGSAGEPALNVLVRRDLRNVAAVVTRYYGGTNLGVGGLARAYARGVNGAVDDAGVVEARPHERLAVVAAYDDSGTVRSILESEGVSFEAGYGERASFEVRVPVEAAEALRDRLRSATSGRVDIR